jgi:hypothetical protein
VANDLPPSTPLHGFAHASGLIKWSIAIGAIAYVGYLGLLLTCDLWRVESLGFVPRFQAGLVTISEVHPDSAGGRAGLRSGDLIKRANTQILESRTDWQRVRTHLDPSKPLELVIERAGRTFTARLPLTSGIHEWRAGSPHPGLVAFRLAQIVTLALALLIALKRSHQPTALLGSLLLASIATLSVALPMRLIAFWQALPGPVGLLLWVPFATSVAVGPLLFAFFAVFPRRIWTTARMTLALVPAVIIVGWHLYGWREISRAPGPPTGLPDWVMPLLAINAAYAALAVALLVVHRRTAETVGDRLRIRALIVGMVLGVTAGIGVLLGYWQSPGADIFATGTSTLFALVFLAVPASFAFAILRPRLFDRGLMIRQGLRYALARRSVAALIPTLGVILLVDILIHRAQPIGEMLQSRWWWFTLVGAALLVVRFHREDWLARVDRRFFRERYDAQRLLRNIADQITHASHVDGIAPAITQQINEALHPTFVSVLTHVPSEAKFSPIVTGSAGTPEVGLPASLSVIGVLSVLRKPLALSLGDTAWVRQQLPLEERALLVARGIELLVPISGRQSSALPLGLLVLGPRRSEDPYNQEDLDLLVTIAQAVGGLLERSAGQQRALTECDSCGRCFDAGSDVCTYDGRPLSAARGSRLLNDRYRLERRLGRGGMGAVYAAVDDLLERRVAVKLIREDVAGPLDFDARFRHEARAAASFAHPHVVRVYDFGVDRDRRPFLVMELLEGTTIRQRLTSDGPLTAPDVLHILRGVCAAVGAAHGQGLVHRDLKPENIFLQAHASGCIPKVLDFGLAKAIHAHRALQQSTVAGTSAGVLVGTLEYMAPEQAAGDDVSPAWDIWALGVMTYEMLTGIHPFRRTVALPGDPTVPGLAANGQDTPELSGTALGFFRTALAPEPALRPSDALGFLASYERAFR